MSAPCVDCPDPNNPCADVSNISWNAAISSCLSYFNVTEGQPLATVINSIACAVQGLILHPDVDTCSDVLISGTYSNIGFTGTDTTTLCNLLTAVDTRFGNINDYSAVDCFGTATNFTNALDQLRGKLCDDLYTADSWLFLPLTGNSAAAPQLSYYMQSGAFITWLSNTVNQSVMGNDTALTFHAGLNGSGHLIASKFTTPINVTLADRRNFDVLTAGTTNLNQDTIKPNYFIDKSSVTTVNLPALTGITVANPMVTFTATTLGQSAANVKLYPAGGETIQGGANYDFGTSVDWVTLIGDSTNWRIISFGTF